MYNFNKEVLNFDTQITAHESLDSKKLRGMRATFLGPFVSLATSATFIVSIAAMGLQGTENNRDIDQAV